MRRPLLALAVSSALSGAVSRFLYIHVHGWRAFIDSLGVYPHLVLYALVLALAAWPRLSLAALAVFSSWELAEWPLGDPPLGELRGLLVFAEHYWWLAALSLAARAALNIFRNHSLFLGDAARGETRDELLHVASREDKDGCGGGLGRGED